MRRVQRRRRGMDSAVLYNINFQLSPSTTGRTDLIRREYMATARAEAVPVAKPDELAHRAEREPSDNDDTSTTRTPRWKIS
eukprot:CAMPEP_0175919934 /NCGR_PEP_ID=MMETSP0108-20121206/12655_1 /TAXON_ID=195067 ORGANISM="Goniomonas pacifica, Strain CCMP1869" /NCGR_SAMPLE_ID=MMETSP0108 /ASSEMBLY_ACC=CAM_ASM_000204 /LENGTH=80 /DNA_ID=CAMNT_0017242607 /DNA_START=269 /DNA_END=509 /DNA_ORIENTATION=+